MPREQVLWLTKGVGGLLFVGAGLCVFGEAVARKIGGEGWFWIGTLSLVLFNFGLCMMFDSYNHQRRFQEQGKD